MFGVLISRVYSVNSSLIPLFGLDIPDFILNNGYEVIKTVFYDMDETKKPFKLLKTFTCRLKKP